MGRKDRRIIIKITPTAILLPVVILIAALLFLRYSRQGKHFLAIDNTPTIVTKIRSLGELTTACYYDEIVLTESKQNSFSSTALGSLARDGLGKDVDDHIVIIAKGTVRAGMDLLQMQPEDIRFSGDTVFIRLPYPQYLDVILNPSDIEVFAESGKWSHEEMTRLQESARKRLLMEADQSALKQKAYEGALEAVTDLLAASGYTYIRFDYIPSYIKLPRFGD